MNNKSGALAGLKVVEFAHVIAGPLSGTLLADLGATVVHVEDPGVGDPQRGAGLPPRMASISGGKLRPATSDRSR